MRVGDRRLRPDRPQAGGGARRRRRARGRFDVRPARQTLSEPAVGRAVDALLAREPDVVVVATTHDQLAENAIAALEAARTCWSRSRRGSARRRRGRARGRRAARGRLVKVGFNHRFHPGSRARSRRRAPARHGEILHLRARYGHGGRLGYEREWRADPARSGGGELIDQGMHLLDLSHWLLGPLPLHSALLRTALLGHAGRGQRGRPARRAPRGPWATLHVTWTEWKNLFSLEIDCRTASCRSTASCAPTAPQRLTRYLMKPELGPARRRRRRLPGRGRLLGGRVAALPGRDRARG